MKLSASALMGLSLLAVNVYAADPALNTVNPAQTIGENSVMSSQDFLEMNKKKEGVVTLPSGLQYKVIRQGQGEKPKASDTVTVNYEGTLIDGTELDSSYKRGEPASFTVSGVISGWVEALQLMPVGSVWELFIPANLAYGERGAPPAIGPDQTLVFKVELLAI